MWLARDTVINKNYIRVGLLDNIDVTQSKLVQWQMKGATQCIRVHHSGKMYDKTYSHRLGIMLRMYLSILHSR
jgi:hypothetical protein